LPASAGTGRPVGEQGGNLGSAPQRRLPPGRRRSRPRSFATPSVGEGAKQLAPEVNAAPSRFLTDLENAK